jgi:hypothetical protein
MIFRQHLDGINRSRLLADSQIVDSFERRSTLPADQRVTVTADERLADGLGAVRAVEIALRIVLEHGRSHYAIDEIAADSCDLAHFRAGRTYVYLPACICGRVSSSVKS